MEGKRQTDRQTNAGTDRLWYVSLVQRQQFRVFTEVVGVRWRGQLGVGNVNHDSEPVLFLEPLGNLINDLPLMIINDLAID